MSGWLDFFEQTIICPECKESLEALFCENGNTDIPPEVKTSLASGKTNCPNCGKLIEDGDLTNTSEEELK